MQQWSEAKEQYIFTGIWNEVVTQANGQYKIFASTAGTKTLLNKYVRLIANRGDTQGWKLAVDASDLITTPDGQQYLTNAFNLSVKAYPGQWLRWWGNSITPFSALQCIVGNITNENRPSGLSQLQHQQNNSVTYNYPSGLLNENTYYTATSVASSRMGQLDSTISSGQKIQYGILFNLVDPEGDIVASFQVDPEIIVVDQ